VYLPNPVKNVTQVEIITARIPNTIYNLTSNGPVLNTLGKNGVLLPSGFYSDPAVLATELTNRINGISSPDYNTSKSIYSTVSTASPNYVTTGLLGYWDISKNTSYPGSGNTITDISGSGLGINLTTTTSPTYISNPPSISGSKFLGPTTWSCPSFMNISSSYIGQMSMETLFYCTNTTTNNEIFTFNGDNSNLNYITVTGDSPNNKSTDFPWFDHSNTTNLPTSNGTLLSFDGTTFLQYSDQVLQIDNTSIFTITFSINISAALLNTGSYMFIIGSAVEGNNWGLGFSLTNFSLFFCGFNYYNPIPSAILSTTSTNNFILTFNNGNLTINLNGTNVFSPTFDSPPAWYSSIYQLDNCINRNGSDLIFGKDTYSTNFDKNFIGKLLNLTYNSTGAGAFYLSTNTSGNFVASFFGGVPRTIQYSSVLPNTWYHVVVTMYFNNNSSTTNLYINGSLVGSSTDLCCVPAGLVSGPPISYQNQIGLLFTNNTNVKVGLARLYNHTLTSAEVLKNYNSAKY
jgi:hypothetical protein